jgi:tetratricopeptide (TPR) repeat protein
MDAEAVLSWMDTLVLAKTGKRLSELQRMILKLVWQGQKYVEIAAYYGCTEGHAKDVGSDLWKFLSQVLGEKITKTNCRNTLTRYLKATLAVSPPSKTDSPPPSPSSSPSPHSPTCPAPLLLPCSPAPLPSSPALSLIGRSDAIAHLDALITQGVKIIVIQGEGGLGKTTLAQQYLQNQGFEIVLELLMAKETQHITPAERVVEEWLKHDFGEEPSVEFGVNLARFKRQLHTHQVGILIDNLEPALDQQGHFIACHRSYVELLRVLADVRVQSVTLMTSRDRLCESSLNIVHYRLPGLDLAAWHQFFETQQMAIDATILKTLHKAYGGNAKVMGILCGMIQEDFAGDMPTYWQEQQGELLVATDLQDLIASQVNRLQALDPQAYRLFCRLSCYRYQEVPSVPLQGLSCLLWDVPISHHRQMITSLRNRSLVEYHNGKYWLHPAIRAESINRLRASEEWATVNYHAAEFWTSSVPTIETTQDALQALEAYYHYIEINDFEAAGQVILKPRNNRWKQFLPLGSTLYRMGFLQPVLTAITQVIGHLEQSNAMGILPELYNILGDLHWITGKIHAAIACQQKAIALATQMLQSLPSSNVNKHRQYYLRMLEVDSLLSMGLYNIDLWELEEAAQLFRQVIDRAQHTEHQRWAEKAIVCLALVYSYLGTYIQAHTLATKIYHSIGTEQRLEKTGQFAYFIQILGQTYANLNDFDKANELYQRAIVFAEAGHYTQVKAKTLVGLAELYRQRQDFAMAIAHHLEAIELLNTIGAKCDLAEAHFQLSLTYQALNQMDNVHANHDRAIHLFAEMEAPKQVRKVIGSRE